MTEAKEAEVNVAKNRSFSLTSDSIITFDRAYIDSDLFQAYEENQIFFAKNCYIKKNDLDSYLEWIIEFSLFVLSHFRQW